MSHEFKPKKVLLKQASFGKMDGIEKVQNAEIKKMSLEPPTAVVIEKPQFAEIKKILVKRMLVSKPVVIEKVPNARFKKISLEQPKVCQAVVSAIQNAEIKESPLELYKVQNIELTKVPLEAPKFQNTEIKRAPLEAPKFQNTEIKRAPLEAPKFQNTEIKKVPLEAPKFQNTEIKKVPLEAPKFQNTEIKKVPLEAPKFQNTEIKKVPLEAPKFQNTEIKRAPLEAPKVENTEIKKVPLEAPIFQNTEIKKVPLEAPKFQNTEIKRAPLEAPKFQNTEIKKVPLEAPKFQNTEIKRAPLEAPKFQNTEIKKVPLEPPKVENSEIKKKVQFDIAKIDKAEVIEKVDVDNDGWQIDPKPSMSNSLKKWAAARGLRKKYDDSDDEEPVPNEKPIDVMHGLQKMELQRCIVRRASFAFKSKIVKQKSVIIEDKFYIHDSLRDLGDKDAETKIEVLRALHREILYVPSSLLEERDKSDMCLLHRILLTFPNFLKKDDQSNEMIKLVLMKSNTNFKQEDRKILRLLKSYDKQEPYSVKFFQQQILNNEEAKFMMRMLRSEEDQKKAIGIQKNFRDLLEVAFAIGNVTCVEYLVKQGRQFYQPGELDYPVLTIAILSSIYVKAEYKEKYFKCMDYVLFQVETDINARDINGNTALHIVNDEFVLEKILRKKPMLSIQNKNGQFPLHNVTLDVLMNILNSIVTNVPARIMDDPNFWEVIKTKELALKNMIFIDFTMLCPEDVNILDFIRAIEQTKHLTTAINHSVVTTMLELSWMEFKHWIKLERQAMFVALFSAVLMFFVHEKFYLVILGLMTSLVLLFETLKVYRCFIDFFVKKYETSKAYLDEQRKRISEIIKNRSFHRTTPKKDDTPEEETEVINTPVEEYVPVFRIYTFLLLDLPLLLLLILYSIYMYHDKDCDWIIGVATILSAFNITIFHSFFNEMVANYLIMLLHVAFNGVQFLLSTIFILLGFALSFMKLISNYDSKDEEINKRENRTEILEVGKSISLSILKTLVMATGEMEAGDLQFHYFISYLVFVLFIFAIPIVFMNLLNGLALEDVQQIKGEAKFLYRKFQLMFLCEVDYLNKNKGYFKGFNFNLSPDLLKDHAFIGIKTTTCDIYSFEKINQHRRIGKLNPEIVKEIIEILHNQRKAYNENGKG